MSAPAIVIRLELEAAPRVYMEALHEGDGARLGQWLASRVELLELVELAMRLENERRAA